MSTEVHCMIWNPDDETQQAAGLVTFPDLGPPTIKLLDPFDPDPPQPGPVSRTVPLLHGRIAGLGDVTILDGTWTQFQLNATHNQTLRVGWLLVGALLQHRDDDLIQRMEITFPSLEALLGSYPLQLAQQPPDDTGSVEFELDDRDLTWDADGVCVRWRYDWSIRTESTDAQLAMTPRTWLSCPDPHSLDWWVDEWLSPINHLIAILSGSPSNPSLIRAWPLEQPTKEERHHLELKVYGAGVGNNGRDIDFTRVLVPAPAIDLNPGGIHDVLRRLKDLGNRHEVFFSLLTDSIRYRERPPRNRYLDLTAALEAYHGVEYGMGPIDEDEFKERKTEAFKAVKPHLTTEIIRFLKRWFPGRSHFSLEDKIRTLATTVDLGGDWRLGPKEMGQLRNDVAHGNTGLSAQAIKSAHDQALDVARRLVLKDLGMVKRTAEDEGAIASPDGEPDQS